ncbi:hypothetical protein [Bordetella pseudohinzii]|uniref:Uncharacterized protein n=1 Tax=Bordetella pseudohinzii TaxID=1331258 RepID=A0A0J6BSU6_9BORD|nr:hypothetical protein [Bordetella pseudohinzii]ANY17199.1 hypothetical protein BBN53_15740 [Bordetella pseudohinzii]KMM24909.1 hypothetical protein L540_03520 [Bordetella pseudohinzii]KXA79095.1 hypothetical protein AW877_09980 [Bordetella pseudohinzii]KXA80203.1 hypothetical protein AW878_07930 [Bordetella pseudohinzii]CUI97723.1 Uncharacterised protein [Bordetella pseudohinzii]
MQTIVATAAGFGVLALFGYVGRRRPQLAFFGFIAAWLAICVAHMTYAVRVAALGASEEVAGHAVVFGLPAALAFVLGLWARRREGGRSEE